jgi:hypothetical protein
LQGVVAMTKLFLLVSCFVLILTPSLRAEPWWLERALNQTKFAAIIGDWDDRFALILEGEKLGFSSSEIARLHQIIGKLICTKEDQKIEGAAIALSGAVLLTTGHTFVPKNEEPRPPSTCFFQLMTNPEKRTFVSETLKIGFEKVPERANNDWALIKLSNPLPKNIEYLPVLPREVRVGDVVYLFSTREESLPARIQSGQLIVRRCNVKDVFGQFSKLSAVFLTDCDGFAGASGGPTLIRVGGKLYLVGIVKGGAGAEHNYKPYSLDGGVFTLHIAVAGKIWRTMQELQRQ